MFFSIGCGYNTTLNIMSLTMLFMFICKRSYKQNLFLQVTLLLFDGTPNLSVALTNALKGDVMAKILYLDSISFTTN